MREPDMTTRTERNARLREDHANRPEDWRAFCSAADLRAILSDSDALEAAERGLIETKRKLEGAKARAEAAEARVKELETALEPFAKQAEQFDDIPGIYRCNDDVEVWQKTNWRCSISVGDLRTARAVLNPERPNG